VFTRTARSLLGRIIERSIKSNKTLTAEEQGQHQATGSGAGKTSTAEPEEIMMIEKTWMQPYLGIHDK
jgi:hypothetical protein